jgi:hypothetical protein
MATAAPSSRLSLSSVGINTSGSEGYYKSNLDLVLKENKQLKQRLDQLEKENRGLKKAVYDLSVRYRMDLSLSIPPPPSSSAKIADLPSRMFHARRSSRTRTRIFKMVFFRIRNVLNLINIIIIIFFSFCAAAGMVHA